MHFSRSLTSSIISLTTTWALLPPSHLPPTFLNLNISANQPQPQPYDPRPNAPVGGATWAIEASCCGYGAYTPEAVNTSSYVVGGLFDLPCGRASSSPVVAEWGYEFFNNQNDIFTTCGNLTEANYTSPPTDRIEALDRLTKYWQCRVAAAAASASASASASTASPSSSVGAVSIPGHYFVNGPAVTGGQTAVVGSEILENINSVNLHLAFTRGIARQAFLPFTIDVSPWEQGFIRDYAGGFWGTASSPVGGHSISLFKRAYYAVYMSGASSVIAEAGAVNYFASNVTSPVNGSFPLSPLGEVGAEFYAITHGGIPISSLSTTTIITTEWVRGIPYTPIAFLFPITLGAGIGFFYRQQSWDAFPYSPQDLEILHFLTAVWPAESFTVMNDLNTAKSEVYYSAGSKYGEIFDILQDANLTSTGAIARDLFATMYQIIAFPGFGAVIDDTTCAFLLNYVENDGGTVWISAEDVATNPSCWSDNVLGADISAQNATTTITVSSVEVDGSSSRSSSSSSSSSASQVLLYINSSALSPICASENDSSWYIKVGGDPNNITGWDGGIRDKCCRKDAGDCEWYGSLGECEVALLLFPNSLSCLACATGESSIGCPAWSDLPPNTQVPTDIGGIAIVTDVQSNVRNVMTGVSSSSSSMNTTAQVVEVSTTPLMVATSYGKGMILTSLTSSSTLWSSIFPALNARSTILQLLVKDVTPVPLQNITSTWTTPTLNNTNIDPVIQYHLNRQPSGWNVTLINNHGVMKEPGAAEVVDSTMTLTVQVTSSITVTVGPGDVAFTFVED